MTCCPQGECPGAPSARAFARRRGEPFARVISDKFPFVLFDDEAEVEAIVFAAVFLNVPRNTVFVRFFTAYDVSIFGHKC